MTAFDRDDQPGRVDHLVILIGFDDAPAVTKMVCLLRSFNRPPDILVIENGTARYDDPTFEVLQTERNIGYTGAANLGISMGFGRNYSFVTIANVDIDLQEGEFADLRVCSRHRSARRRHVRRG